MRYGFTGTRNGMTPLQRAALVEYLELNIGDELHHGDCVGADDEAADTAWKVYNGLRWPFRIVCHPPVDEKLRAFNKRSDEVLPPKTPFARNRDIVDACDVLLVAPMHMERQDRGGTWYTYDFATRRGKKVVVFWPDGTVS